MSPLCIEIMLHYYSMTNDYGHDGVCGSPCDAPAVQKTLKEFLSGGLLNESIRPNQKYDITDRGRAYVQYLTEVPLPIMQWIIIP